MPAQVIPDQPDARRGEVSWGGKGRLTAEERSVREPNIALKRLPADREDRRLSFFGGIFGGQTFRAPSLLRSAEKEKH